MALRIKEDMVQLESIIGSNSAQTVAEGTITIPGSMPSAERIVKVSAVPSIREDWLEEDRVNIEGAVSITLIYAGQYETGKAYYGSVQATEVVPFAHFVDVPGALPDMQVSSRANLLDLQPTLRSDGRTIDLDLILEVTAVVTVGQDMIFVTDASVSPPTKLKLVREPVHVEDVIGEGAVQAEIREMLSVPVSAGHPVRMLDLQGHFRVVEKRTMTDRAIILGTMNYKAICAGSSPDTGDEQLLVYRWDDISRMELTAAIPGSKAGMIVHSQLEPPRIVGRIVNDGQFISVEGTMGYKTKVVQPRDITAITDVQVEPDLEIGLRWEPIMINQIGDSVAKEVYIDGTVELPESRPPLERLLDTEFRAAVTSTTVVGNRVMVSGYVDLAAIYIGRTDDFAEPVYQASWNNAGVFEASMNVPTVSVDAGIDANVVILDTRAEPLSRDTIGYHVTAKVSCRVKEPLTKEIVAEAVELRKFPGRLPTYTCVNIQPDDTMWQLATRYRTTAEALLEQNPDLVDLHPSQVLPVGTRVFITKHGASSLL